MSSIIQLSIGSHDMEQPDEVNTLKQQVEKLTEEVVRLKEEIQRLKWAATAHD